MTKISRRRQRRPKKPLSGTPENGLCVLNFIKSRYRDACVIIPVLTSTVSAHTDISLRWLQDKQRFSVPHGFWESFRKCGKSRFVVFPFGFTCQSNLGHANYMVYDRKNRSLERFDPYGQSKRKCLNPSGLDDKIAKLFEKNLGQTTYYTPVDLYEKYGIQQQQENEGISDSSDPNGGYCLAWSCWYVQLRLDNPDSDRTRLVSEAVKEVKKSGSLTEYIRGYSADIVDFCDRR